MLAYNRQTLDNLEIKEAAEQALRKDYIDAATYRAIEAAHPVNFYTPNPVIKVGLFILTVVIAAFSLGLLTLIALEAVIDGNGFAGLTIFAGLVCYGALELLVHEKKLFRSGIDDALLWCAVALLVGSLATGDHTALTWCLVTFIITLAAALRFADMVIAGVAYLSFLALVFNIVIRLGPIAKTIAPFVIMALSLGIYFLVRRSTRQHAFRHYKHCLTMVTTLSLLTLYLAGNYYVVRELGNALLGLHVEDGQSIPGALFFWICTIIVPPIYLYLGIRKKDAVLLRTGMILLAAIVFTIRYYHSVMPLEMAMVLGGLVLTLAAWQLIRYLKAPRHGFTYEEPETPSLADKLRLESLIIAQTYAPAAHTSGNDMNFGGGSGGGGGASGDY
jgi:hypothetical protein